MELEENLTKLLESLKTKEDYLVGRMKKMVHLVSARPIENLTMQLFGIFY